MISGDRYQLVSVDWALLGVLHVVFSTEVGANFCASRVVGAMLIA